MQTAAAAIQRQSHPTCIYAVVLMATGCTSWSMPLKSNIRASQGSGILHGCEKQQKMGKSRTTSSMMSISSSERKMATNIIVRKRVMIETRRAAIVPTAIAAAGEPKHVQKRPNNGRT